MPISTKRNVIFQPLTYQKFQKGIHQIVDIVRPTLGPKSSMVAIERINKDKAPELLDSGGVIVRRIIQIPDRDADMGAMFLRQVLWRVYKEVGDGTVTTAVLFQSVYDQGVHYITAGGNAMRLRYYLEEGMKLILNELSKLTVQVEGKESLAQIALSICYDPSLAKLMGEIFDIIGQYGILDIRTGRGRHLEREYVEGIYWDNGVITRDMITDPVSQKVELENVAVLISNLSIDDPQSLLPIFESVLQADIHSMLIFGSEFSGTVIGLLMAANKDPSKFRVIGVKTLGVSLIDQTAAMQDLAVLTGGQPRVKAAGDTLNGLTFNDLGQVRKVRAGYHYVSLFGGKGDPRQLRAHLTSLRAAFDREEDLDQRKKIQKRIGKLMGGSATLWIGAATETEITYRQELAERTADAVRAALREGVLPGGGIALLACRPVLREKFHQSTEPDERAAYQILIKTMEAPIRAILTNAGLDASDVMAELRLAGDNRGYNVMTGKIVNMMEAGIFDVAAVVKSALRGAISSAALALTTDILIHHKKPVQALEP